MRKVGLLFVHGIGQQQPFEHLRASVSEIAELLGRDKDTSCAVTDRTEGWKDPVGTVTTTSADTVPITLTVHRGDETHRFECHEVYWGDLGARSGLLDTIGFWLWGLGQWCCPVYRDLDPAQLPKDAKQANGEATDRPVSQLARLPGSVAGHFGGEVWARALLALSGLGALLTLVSWSLVKRIGGAALHTTPNPSLLVQYVGDVRTYEERARPGDTALSDPGFPRRVGIRRRMITQMVGMGAREDLDAWYVVAHSLGTVVAYNGLTEIGHALPNYLGKAQWNALDDAFKADDGCIRRGKDELSVMMPARPAWVQDDQVINRKLLFDNLAGFVTYGSALGKFAGLWPRVVATATDRRIPDEEIATLSLDPNKAQRRYSVFPENCRWINLHAPQDPVSGPLAPYGAWCDGEMPSSKIDVPFCEFIPKLESFTTPFWQPFLLSHLHYFQNKEAYAGGKAIEQRTKMVKFFLGGAPELAKFAGFRSLKRLGALFFALVVLGLLTALTIAMVTLAGGIGGKLLFGTALSWNGFAGFLCDFGHWAPPTITAALWIVLVAGLLRWVTESRFDWLSMRAMIKGDGVFREQTKLKTKTKVHNVAQMLAALAVFVLTIAIFAQGVPLPHGIDRLLPHGLAGWLTTHSVLPAWLRQLCNDYPLAQAPALGVLAASVQALINLLGGKLRPK